MKYKRFLFYFSFLVCALSVHAQKIFQKERAIGISGGVNFSKVNFVPKVDQGMLLGMNAGVMARWRTEKNLGLQVEINFKQQGWEEKFESTEEEDYSDLYYRRIMNYIELPFLSHIYFGGEKVQFFVNLGPQFGLYLSDKEEQNLDGLKPANRTNFQHGKSIVNKFEWGLLGGPGIELRTGIGSFLLEGRFYYSFGDIFNTRKINDFSKASGQVISVNLTYLIPY